MPDLTTLLLLLFICLFMLFRGIFSGGKKFADKNYIEMFKSIESSIVLFFVNVLLIVAVVSKIVNAW